MTTPGYGGVLRPFARMNKRRYRVDFSNRPFADAEQNPHPGDGIDKPPVGLAIR
jgi:hypothetical protein